MAPSGRLPGRSARRHPGSTVYLPWNRLGRERSPSLTRRPPRPRRRPVVPRRASCAWSTLSLSRPVSPTLVAIVTLPVAHPQVNYGRSAASSHARPANVQSLKQHRRRSPSVPFASRSERQVVLIGRALGFLGRRLARGLGVSRATAEANPADHRVLGAPRAVLGGPL